MATVSAHFHLLAGAVGIPAAMLGSLAIRLPEQAKLRQQRQQQQQKHQQQRQPKGQLPFDQQEELDNSLYTLGLALMRVWTLGCQISMNHFAQQQQLSSLAADAAAAGLEPFRVTATKIAFMLRHQQVAQYAELSLHMWPRDSAAAAGNAASSSSSSSNDLVRYGKQVLPRLAPVSFDVALLVALAAAQTLGSCIEILEHYTAIDVQQLQQQFAPTAYGGEFSLDEVEAFRKLLQQNREAFADKSVLALQLLLLAHQAKMQRAALMTTQGGRTDVDRLTHSALQQQQPADCALGKLFVPEYHSRVLAACNVSRQNIAALEQQHLVALPHIR
jgi:hypothetical protein